MASTLGAQSMKNLYKIIFLLFAFCFLLSTKASAITINSQEDLGKITLETINNSVVGEQIKDFISHIAVQKDGSMEVREEIHYYFDAERHGIFRNIPFTIYENGKRYDMTYKFGDVTDENGKKYGVSKSKSGEQWVLKIGDPNKTVHGDHTYIISYSVKGGLQYFEDHDELYWNITGNGWDIPIRQTTATITLPQNADPTKINLSCYTGPYGSKKQNCKATTNGTTTTFTTTLFLNSYEGLTIVEGFPKGMVETLKPTLYVPFFERWYGKIVLAGIIVGAVLWYLVLPIYLIIKWFRKGRDPDVGVAVTATYEAPKIGKRVLTPAESGALLDETVDKRDLFATIVDLARRGYIKISEPKDKQFFLTKTNPKTRSIGSGQAFLPFEATLYDGIFEDADVIELKKVKFYNTATKVEDMLYKLLVTNGYFRKNPKTTRSLYYALGGVALFTVNFVLSFVSFVFGRFMPAKTLEGAKAAKMAEGLKNFLKSQERQLNFQGDRQMLFEKLLPYAVAFGVEKAWAKRFEKFDLKNPDWYEGTSSTHFNTALFASSLSNSYSNFAVSSTPPSSSGSGFSGGSSGGGGGGGGGGSW